MLCLLLVGCAGVPVPSDGSARPPTTNSRQSGAPKARFACEVRVRETGPNSATLVRRYDAEGRLVFGTIRLSYDGHGTEALRWGPDGLMTVSTSHGHEARQGNCDVVGGCDEPGTRVVAQAELRRRAALIRQIVADEETFAEHARGRWKSVRRRALVYRLDYEHGLLVSVDTSLRQSSAGRATDSKERNRVRFEYEGSRVVRRIFDDGRHRFESRYRWEGGRLTSVQGTGSSHSFEYDPLGRPVRWESWSGDESAGRRRVEWHYDASGQVETRTEASVPLVGRPQSRVYRYEYSGPGRLARVLSDGVVVTEYAYEGACSQVRNAPEIPDALALAQGRFCFKSFGRLFDTCR